MAVTEMVEKEVSNAAAESRPIRGPRAAGFASRFFFCYVTSLVNKAMKEPLNAEDTFDIPLSSEITSLLQLFDGIFQPEGKTQKELGTWRLISKAMKLMFAHKYRKAIGGMCLQALINTFLPLVLRAFIEWFADDSKPFWVGWLFGGILVVAGFVGNAILLNHAILTLFTIGMDIRSVINAVVFRKATRLSQKARSQTTTGQILTIMSADSERLPMAMVGLGTLCVAPFSIVIGIVLLSWVMGWVSLVAIIFLFGTAPVPLGIGRFQGKVIGQLMQLTDRRVKLVNEGLQGVKVLKYYAWDTAYADKVREARNVEMAQVRKQAWSQAVSNAFASFSPILMGMLMLIVEYFVYPENFTAANVFTALALINVVRMPMIMLPLGIMSFVSVKTTMIRLQKYLLLDDISASSEKEGGTLEKKLSITNASFQWDIGEPIDLSGKGKGKGKGKDKGADKKSEGKGNGNDQPADATKVEVAAKPADGFRLRDISAAASAGELIMIVGSVGSGKTSLLSSVLGDMPKRSGEVQVHGSIAYCAQLPWIMNATLRENILYGTPMEEDRYDEVMTMCALVTDCESLPGGDLTEIGEKGVTLSGGQKARVALARACYRQAGIYMLDDVLSAVDSETGNWLFEHCIQPLRAKGSIVLLATNNVHFLEHASSVWVVNAGMIVEQGAYADLRGVSDGALNRLLSSVATEEVQKEEDPTANHHTQANKKCLDIAASSHMRQQSSIKKGMLTEKETKQEGNVSWRVWFYYFVTNPGSIFSVTIIAISLLTQASKNVFEWWLSRWTNELVKNPDLGLDYNFYVYVGLGICATILFLARALFWSELILRNGFRLHEHILLAVLRAPMEFFDTTPLGRIINRFSKDINSIDQEFQRCLPQFVTLSSEIVGICITIAINLPLFLIALVPMAVIYMKVASRFRPVSRDLQRMESISRSPLFAQFSETLVGLTTIRAYGDSQRFLDSSLKIINESNRAFFTIQISNRWLQIRLDSLSSFFMLAVVLLTIYGRECSNWNIPFGCNSVTSSVVGLVLYYSVSITGFLNFTIRMAAETEAKMTSTERLHEYAERLAPESKLVTQHRPPTAWPSVGRIELKDVKMRYREGLPLVLNGLSVIIEGGMKVGICGRTGCGKSTLFGVLFRLVDISSPVVGSGSMLIDAVDVLKLGLHDLRKALAIIPQDAMMFSGTLRDNLDLFHTRSEEEIWSALRHASLEGVVQSLPGGLEDTVQEGGENFSVGQRQLVCLARALLRQSQIICLDEATANIDVKTDATLQQVIRTEFSDRTVLTIAHRLNTIIDSDRILFLEEGKIAEYDAPANLLAKGHQTRFKALIDELGEEAAADIKRQVLGAEAVSCMDSPQSNQVASDNEGHAREQSAPIHHHIAPSD